jgi:enamine deaminase RidA (YjgF/YER057c/UK114 family)
MERRAIRVEPISSYLERRRKGPIFPVVVAGGFVFVSGLPPFDPVSGEPNRRPFDEQAEIVLEQMKRCLEAAGSSLERVVKCNVYCSRLSRPAISRSGQNIVLPFAAASGTTCNTSQCSTIFPSSSSRKMSMPAQSRSL